MRRHSNTPSLGRIAEQAGVSRAAVSMALRNHPRIPVSTRERIQSIAKDMGWKPNPLLAEAMSAIRAGQPPVDRVTLAWVTTGPHRDDWKSSAFDVRCHEGAVERADSAGYRLETFWLGDANNNPERLGDILYNRGINGVLIAPLREPGTLSLQWERFAAATVAHTLITPRLHSANDNHVASARVCVARMHAANRRRIGFALSAKLDHRVADLWSAGYLLETFEEGLADPKLLHRPEEYVDEATFIRWVKKAKPDGVIGTNRQIPEWLKTAGFRVPQDIAYANLDLASTDGEFAGIFQDARAIGAGAIDMIAGQLLRHERGVPEKPKTNIIDGHWIDGATMPKKIHHPEFIDRAKRMLHNVGDPEPARPVVYD